MRVGRLFCAKWVLISFTSVGLGVGVAPSAFALPQQSKQAAVVATSPGGGPVQAGVPSLIQSNGTLKDAAGRAVSGVASVTFTIYDEQDNGSALWSETQNVLADANGHYTMLLGAATANGVPSDLFGTGESRWLGVAIARQPEMPRVLMASVPYALKAGDADTLGGLPASSYVTTEQLAAHPPTPVASAGGGTIIPMPGVATAGPPLTSSDAAQSVIQANPTGSGTADYIPLWTSGSNLGNSAIFQTGGKLGIGTITPASTLDINGGEILRGGFYEYPQGTATASTGQPSHSFQWIASLFDSSTSAPVNLGFGFRAVPVGNNTSNPSATLDLFSGTGGPDGTLVDTGLSINGGGIITFASGQTFGASTFTSITLPASTASGPQVFLGTSPFLSTGTSGTNSIYMGTDAGAAGGYTPSGSANVGIGLNALESVTTGEENTAIGGQSSTALAQGDYNTAVGFGSLTGNAAGDSNFAGGYFSLAQATGTGNTAVGYLADGAVTTGNYNTAFGYYANVGSSSGAISYSTAIGANATVTESDAIVLGNTTLVNGLIPPPNVGIGTTAPRSTLEISSPIASSFSAPGPILTLSNESTGTSNGVAIDFDPGNPASTLPFARIEASGQSSGGELDFFTNTNGSGTTGALLKTMAIDTFGNVSISGSLYVTGEVQKASGNFKIDDPIDPANKYLYHSFVESPDMMNIYNGNIVTDADGVAVVALPAWFEALNQDFRYQLTTIGQRADAWIDTEIAGNKFTIRTDKPNVKVSWQVTGVRHDAYANAHRSPIEEEKPAAEQGHYLHPELFGAGEDQRVRNAIAPPHAVAPGAPSSSLPASDGSR